jgi:hypothetical protein
MVRLCFSRKNKTMGAIFKKDSVLELLLQNYKTYCALNNIVRVGSRFSSKFGFLPFKARMFCLSSGNDDKLLLCLDF